MGGCFSYKLYRLFLFPQSFSVTIVTLGFLLFFILLQINFFALIYIYSATNKLNWYIRPCSGDIISAPLPSIHPFFNICFGAYHVSSCRIWCRKKPLPASSSAANFFQEFETKKNTLVEASCWIKPCLVCIFTRIKFEVMEQGNLQEFCRSFQYFFYFSLSNVPW